jgi:hypothetical protein
MVIDDADDCVPIGGFLNGVRPVNLAQAMADAVESGTAYVPLGGAAPADFDVSKVDIDRPLFDNVQPEVKPDEDVIWIGSGTTQLCAWWAYAGMADGVKWDALWAVNGEFQPDVSHVEEVWSGGAEGDWWVCIAGDEPIEEGIWDLTINVEGEWVGGSFVAVGDRLEPVDFTFANASDLEVCYLFISPDVVGFWGSDWFGPDVAMDPGESVTYRLPPATYDLLGEDCEREDLFQERQEVLEATTFTYE